MYIRTKIVATVGPACGSITQIRKLVKAGVDMFRINFSHGDNRQRAEFIKNIRFVEKDLNQPIAICADLCGPKIRIGMMKSGGVLLAQGQHIFIQRDPVEGDATKVSTTLGELIDDVKVGETILIDDGKIKLKVLEIDKPDKIECKIEVGGILKSGKGINLPDSNLHLSAMTEKDHQDAAWITGKSFDYVALSFVQRAQDILDLKKILHEHSCKAQVIAKIEKPKALDNIEDIIEATDGIMVARGDLGVEMNCTEVPVAQKNIARRCQQVGKPCIIATQMLESMIESPTPTRAEVSDVANAVLDHADAVMLSGETAVGKYPAKAVTIMNETADAIQSYRDTSPREIYVEDEESPTTAAVANAVRSVVKAEQVQAVVVFSATGATARTVAKNRLPVPVVAISPYIDTVRRMYLYYGVIAKQAPNPKYTNHMLDIAEKAAIDAGVAKFGDRLVVITGRPVNIPGKTNTIIIHKIE